MCISHLPSQDCVRTPECFQRNLNGQLEDCGEQFAEFDNVFGFRIADYTFNEAQPEL